MDEAEDHRRFAPSTARNRDVIRDVFLAHAPTQGRVLEIAGGAGEHAVHIASDAPNLTWFVGDPDETARRSIRAWIDHAGLENIRGPHAIDAARDDWGLDAYAPVDMIVSINMIHIAPFEACEGLVRGASEHLAHDGKLFLYGPYRRHGEHTALSNAAFDESLRMRDPRWGIRDLDTEIIPLCAKHGLELQQVVEMPANNFVIIFGKSKKDI